MKKIILCLVLVVAVLVALFFHSSYVIIKASVVTKGDKIADYGKKKSALVVIDLQNDITQKDGRIALNVDQSDKAIDNINKIINTGKMETVYIMQQFTGLNPLIRLFTNGALRDGSKGFLIDSRIKIKGSNIFVKYISDSFSNNDFEDFLIKNKINHLYITGADAEYCVDKTVKGALNRDYRVTIIKDAIVTKTEERRKKKIDDFSSHGAEILETEELLKSIDSE